MNSRFVDDMNDLIDNNLIEDVDDFEVLYFTFNGFRSKTKTATSEQLSCSRKGCGRILNPAF